MLTKYVTKNESSDFIIANFLHLVTSVLKKNKWNEPLKFLRTQGIHISEMSFVALKGSGRGL